MLDLKLAQNYKICLYKKKVNKKYFDYYYEEKGTIYFVSSKLLNN